MSTQASFPTSNAVVTTGWTNPTRFYTADSSFATASISSVSTINSDLGTFGFDSTIPSGSTINSVTVETNWKILSAAGDGTLSVQPNIGGSLYGTALTDTTEPTTATVISKSYTGITRTNLLDANFKVRVGYSRSVGGVANVASCDYIKVTVDYSTPTTYNQAITCTAVGTGLTLTKTVTRLQSLNFVANVLPTLKNRVGRLINPGLTASMTMTHPVAKTISVGLTASATLVRKFGKPFSNALTAGLSILRAITRPNLPFSLALSGTFTRAYSLAATRFTPTPLTVTLISLAHGQAQLKNLVATMSSSASLALGYGKRISGMTISTAVTLTRRAGLGLSNLVFLGITSSKSMLKPSLAPITTALSVFRGMTRTLTPSPVVATPSIMRQYLREFDFSLTAAMTVLRGIATRLVSAATVTAALVRSNLRIVTFGLSTSVTLGWAKGIGRVVSAGMTASLVTVRSIKPISGFSISAVATVSRIYSFSKSISATLAQALTVRQARVKLVAATLASALSIGRVIATARAFSVSLSALVLRGGIPVKINSFLTATASALKARPVSLGFALTATATAFRKVGKPFSNAFTTTVTLARSIGPILRAGIASSATLTRGFALVRSFGLAAAASLAQGFARVRTLPFGITASLALSSRFAYARALAFGLTTAATIRRTVGRVLAAGLVAAVAFKATFQAFRVVQATITASIVLTARNAYARAIAPGISAALTLARALGRPMGFSLTVTATLQRGIALGKVLALTLIVSMFKRIPKAITSTISSVLTILHPIGARAASVYGQIHRVLFRRRRHDV